METTSGRWSHEAKNWSGKNYVYVCIPFLLRYFDLVRPGRVRYLRGNIVYI